MALEVSSLQDEIGRRRTFAIISHPDAGKTTLTEKLLLYSGSVQLAGSVRARRNQRSTISDWMAMEQQRGISITSTVLAFEYGGCRCNLLDTPGHADFSEDTYRTLQAADSAVMVLDAARGVEAQTRKLFEVCRDRGVPILTFVNKMDRPAMTPLELLSVIEDALGIEATPVNWPIGDGPGFQGVYDRGSRSVHRYERSEHGARQAAVRVAALEEAALDALLGAEAAAQLRDDVALLDGVESRLDLARFAAGTQTPVFFGSALTNFGVDLFLDRFVQLAPAPGAVDSPDADFAAFVFKIQSNMNPLHRDSVAFLRVTRGGFLRDTAVTHGPTGRRIRLGHASALFASERETVDSGCAGDIVGLPNPGFLAIGDTLYVGAPPDAVSMPRFQPEHFAVLRGTDVSKHKAFRKGIDQLQLEGATQVLYGAAGGRRDPVLAAVGRLQFDVVQFRLKAEYGVDTQLDPLPYAVARWLDGPEDEVARFQGWGTMRCEDHLGRPVVLFGSDRDLDFFARENPQLQFREVSEAPAVEAAVRGGRARE